MPLNKSKDIDCAGYGKATCQTVNYDELSHHDKMAHRRKRFYLILIYPIIELCHLSWFRSLNLPRTHTHTHAAIGDFYFHCLLFIFSLFPLSPSSLSLSFSFFLILTFLSLLHPLFSSFTSLIHHSLFSLSLNTYPTASCQLPLLVAQSLHSSHTCSYVSLSYSHILHFLFSSATQYVPFFILFLSLNLATLLYLLSPHPFFR